VIQHLKKKEAENKDFQIQSEKDEDFVVNLRTRFPMREWLDKIQCKLSVAQLVALCPSFGRKMADKIDLLTNKDLAVQKASSIGVAWHLPVSIKGQSLAALLDTGSALTIIGERCAQALGLKPETCPPLTMRMANDTKTVTTQYLPSTVITIGGLEIPARIIVMPNVQYDLLLGKDFLSATSAKIEMDEDSAETTLSWNGKRQTFSLTDDLGEYGLIGCVEEEKDKQAETDEESEQVINKVEVYSQPKGIFESLKEKVKYVVKALLPKQEKENIEKQITIDISKEAEEFIQERTSSQLQSQKLLHI
jgi:hypothetical protein